MSISKFVSRMWATILKWVGQGEENSCQGNLNFHQNFMSCGINKINKKNVLRLIFSAVQPSVLFDFYILHSFQTIPSLAEMLFFTLLFFMSSPRMINRFLSYSRNKKMMVLIRVFNHKERFNHIMWYKILFLPNCHVSISPI